MRLQLPAEPLAASCRLKFQETDSPETQMTLFFYMVLFVATCCFGWWARNMPQSQPDER